VLSLDESIGADEIIEKFLKADPEESSFSQNEWGSSFNLK